MDKLDTPGSTLTEDIPLFIAFENVVKTGPRLVLIDEKLGFIILDKDERPGPQNIVGYTLDINCVVVEILEPSTVDSSCSVE